MQRRLLLLCALVLFTCEGIKCSASETKDQKTVLFLAAYQKSPIIALQGLAEEMAQRNYRVLFAATNDDEHLISSTSNGVEFLSAGDPPKDAPIALDIISLFTGENLYAREMYDALLPVLTASPPDLIVFDPLSIAGEALAEQLNIPSVHVAAHLLDVAYLGVEPSPSYPMVITGYASSKMSLVERLINTVHIAAARFILPVVRGFIQNEFRNYAGLPSKWFEWSTPYGNSKLAIIANHFGTEYARPLPGNIQMTGPLLPRSHRPLSKQIETWLAESDLPVVYISIGTNSIWTEASVNAVLEAIIEGSVKEGIYRVLWSIKSHQQSLMNPSRLEIAMKSLRVMIVPFVEQLAILEHNSTKVFVTHSGLSSVTESLFNGVPMLAMPMMLESDQPTIAARLEELGVGIRIDRRQKEVTKQEFSSKLETILKDPNFYRQAERFQTIYRTLNGRKRAADLLEVAMFDENFPKLLQSLDASIFSNLDVYLVLLLLAIVIWKIINILLSWCFRPRKMKQQ